MVMSKPMVSTLSTNAVSATNVGLRVGT